MDLKKSSDVLLLKKGATPTSANGYLTDGNVDFKISPKTFEVDLIGDGRGNGKDQREIKENIPVTLDFSLVLMEPTELASGIPQMEVLESCGYKQLIDTTEETITIYPDLEGTASSALYYKGGIMEHPLAGLIGSIDLKASAKDSKVSVPVSLMGNIDPKLIANKSAKVEAICVENSFFRLTKDSYITVDGVAICPFGEIEINTNPEKNDGDDTIVCSNKCIYDFAPELTFSEVATSLNDSNLNPLVNWLNDENVTISFPLFSKNYKLEIKVNAGVEKLTQEGESGGRWLQKRKIRLKNDIKRRAFEFVITPL